MASSHCLVMLIWRTYYVGVYKWYITDEFRRIGPDRCVAEFTVVLSLR